jgi:Cu2+-exporting ATPase
MAEVDVVIFDKTGTLTEGRPRLVDVVPAAGIERQELLHVAGALERDSEHPLARATRDALAGAAPVAIDVVNFPGRGLTGRVEGEAAAVGSLAFVAAATGAEIPPALAAAATGGASPVAVARGARSLGLLLFEDRPREGARELIAALTGAGTECEILSGDHPEAVARAAALFGVAQAEGAATPERKVERVRELVAAGRKVAMIGDGVNDAAALSAATVSVAMGGGALLAARSADAVLASSRSDDLAFAFAHARRTMRVLRGNFVRALSYNALILPLAATGNVPPWAAAIGMTASSALVVLNASRLRRDGRADGGAATPASPSPAALLPAPG